MSDKKVEPENTQELKAPQTMAELVEEVTQELQEEMSGLQKKKIREAILEVESAKQILRKAEDRLQELISQPVGQLESSDVFRLR